jgi:hypothetical protein
MAYNGGQVPTLIDMAKSLAPDGSIATVAEILTETNEMLVDIPFFEGNLPTGHRTTIRTGIPAPTWRQFYGGVQPSKSTRAQITDTCAMMEAYGLVDKALADLSPNLAAFRMSEDYAHIEGMSQAAQQAFIYGSAATDITQFNGLAPRFNALTGAGNSQNIISAGGVGSDNASIWLVLWGEQTVHGIYPKGSQAGLQMRDLGEQTAISSDGNGDFQAYRSHYRWDLGLCVRDWRYVVRICNIDRSLLSVDLSTGANLPDLMFQALERVPSLTLGTPVFYMDRSLRTMLRRQMPNAIKNSTLPIEMVGGLRTYMFQEVPIRRVDKMSPDEALVS